MKFWNTAFMAAFRTVAKLAMVVNVAHTIARTEGEAEASPASEAVARMSDGIRGGTRERKLRVLTVPKHARWAEMVSAKLCRRVKAATGNLCGLGRAGDMSTANPVEFAKLTMCATNSNRLLMEPCCR